jgi:LppX_LprAFG lipoprotein
VRTSSNHPSRRFLVRLAAGGLALALTTALGGCSGGSSTAHAGVGEVLAKAKTSLDQATTVHFVLSSADVPPGKDTKLVGGNGFAVRPNAFTGSLKLLTNGAAVTIQLISLGGKVYIKSPFNQKFAVVDPAKFGLKDPATLVDQKNGVVRLITSLTGATLAGQGRVGRDVVQQVTGNVPGTVVADLLTSADPSKPVAVTASVDEKTGQLRQAVLTGPFYDAAKQSTFTIVFDRYGEQVDVRPPVG